MESHDWGFAGGDAERARILGGCSSHNACDVAWAAPGDHARWVELGNPGWGFEEQAPYLKLAETQLRSRVPASGELTVLEASFLDAVDEVGLCLLERLNGPGWGPGAARIPKNMVGTTRWNAAFAYLDPVRARPNLRIQAETLVDRIVLEGTRPTAIIAHTAEGEQRVRVNLVVLAAGAYMSPAILQRSGIGPEEELARLGVPAVAPLPGFAPFVGRELVPGPVTDLEGWVRGNSGGYWHPVGTCRMGRAGDPGAVVDEIGRVHGVDGVVVADASIFPTIPRANTNLPTMAAAEYIASTAAVA